MGRRVIAISGELLSHFCTEGHEIGHAGIATCTSGLLPGAKLLFSAPTERPGHDGPVFLFFYEHPDWEGGGPGETVPDLAIEYSRSFQVNAGQKVTWISTADKMPELHERMEAGER